MQKILYTDEIESYQNYMEPNVINYIREGQINTFECFEEYSLFAFEWYDIDCDDITTSKILIYLDREDLFIMCGDERVYKVVGNAFAEIDSNERALYLFFVELLKTDTEYLEKYETEITDAENRALVSSRKNYLSKIVAYRKELLRMKRYYDQLDDIFDNLTANDNNLLTKQGIRYFHILGNRTERLRGSVLNLRDYVTQMREAYQAQIDIEQNNFMRVFTVITAVFLPLTLMVGWYEMNFQYMPELSYKYSYVIFIIVSIVISVALLVIFKKKKWF